MAHALLAAAERITDSLLLPDAESVDRRGHLPADHLEALARSGLYGIEAAEGLSDQERWLITEMLASGCMSTAFVWIQHHSAVRALLETENGRLRAAWLDDLLAGTRRAGIAIGGLRPPEPSLHATAEGSAWRLDGEVPWVTGWGLVDAMLVGAATDDGRELWALTDLSRVEGLEASPYRLVAANASATVRLRIRGRISPQTEIIGLSPRRPPDPLDGGGRSNGSLALGVARRAIDYMESSHLAAELDRVRSRLDSAGPAELAGARAAGSELALRAAASLTVDMGSRAIAGRTPAERLMREAQFTAVFGTRPAIKRALLDQLEERL